MAAQLKPRSGDAASNNNRQWPYFQQMSFLKGNTYRQSTGNLDNEFDDDDDEDEQTEEPIQKSPPLLCGKPVVCKSSNTSTTSQSTSPKVECKSVISQEWPLEIEDPTKKSEWLFLLSILDYFNKVTDNTLKMQLRLEMFCLLFNFLTQNKEIINQDACEKNQTEMTVASSLNAGKYLILLPFLLISNLNYILCNTYIFSFKKEVLSKM